MLNKIIISSFFFLLFIGVTAYAAAPVIFYSDLQAGPNTGGQSNNGVFVTIWGNNFIASGTASQVTVGGGTVANIQTWSNTMICFQLGSSAATGNIVVTTSGGTSNGLAFTVQSGNIYFVNPAAGTNGSGSYASPFNNIYYGYNAASAGDTIYVESGTIQNQVNGRSGYHAILCEDKGGTSGHPVSYIAYPNATVNVIVSGGTATSYNGGGANGDTIQYGFRSYANWVTVAKFNIQGTGTSNIVEMIQADNQGWNAIGNSITAAYWNYGIISVQGSNNRILGNTIYNSGESQSFNNEDHAIYIAGPTNPVEVGWNYMYGNNNLGWEISNYHNGPRIGSIHDNLIIASAGAGSDKGILADGCGDLPSPDTASTMYTNSFNVYNNILVNTGQTSNGGAIQANCGTNYIYNNTIYYSGTEQKGVIQFQVGYGPSGGNPVEYLANNIIYANNSGLYLSDSNGNAPTWSMFSYLGKNNYYGEGNGPTNDTTAINANPLLVNPTITTSGNWGLQSSSPAIGVGYNTNSVCPVDYNGVTRPSAPDIGSQQYTSSSCTANGGFCSGGPVQASCCSDLCNGTSCVSCLSAGASCTLTSQCCIGTCTGSVCYVPATNGIQSMVGGNTLTGGNTNN